MPEMPFVPPVKLCQPCSTAQNSCADAEGQEREVQRLAAEDDEPDDESRQGARDRRQRRAGQQRIDSVVA